jgi:hypothetical protein
MKSYCLKNQDTGKVFRILLTEEELTQLMDENPRIVDCCNCQECFDAPSITLED